MLTDCSSDVQMHDDELEMSGSLADLDAIDIRRGLKIDGITGGRSGHGVRSMDEGEGDGDGDDNTCSSNYELIEYLKRREQRDEEMLKRMDAREERLLNLFERTVVAIEALSAVMSPKQCNDKATCGKDEANSRAGDAAHEEVMVDDVTVSHNDDRKKPDEEISKQGEHEVTQEEDAAIVKNAAGTGE